MKSNGRGIRKILVRPEYVLSIVLTLFDFTMGSPGGVTMNTTPYVLICYVCGL